MNKAPMIPIRPEHAINILNGEKTLELRTWIPKDYVGWVYAYVTKSKPYLVYQDGYRDGRYFEHEWHFLYGNSYEKTLKTLGHAYTAGIVNGLVVFRFWFDDYETYDFDNHGVHLYTDVEEYNVMYDDLERLCLDYREVETYGKGKPLYAWHIKKLEIFDEPKQLSEFYRLDSPFQILYIDDFIPLTKAPQKMVWVYVNE